MKKTYHQTAQTWLEAFRKAQSQQHFLVEGDIPIEFRIGFIDHTVQEHHL